MEINGANVNMTGALGSNGGLIKMYSCRINNKILAVCILKCIHFLCCTH